MSFGMEQVRDIAPKAIATTYRRYEFRSRLEAKWAAFFDLCGWKWSYEPLDLDGWIPDFAIGSGPTLVECKPFFHGEQWTEAVAKIKASGCQQDVVLLGADPTWRLRDEGWREAPVVGWIAEASTLDGRTEFVVFELNFGFCDDKRKPSLCSLDGAWRNIITGDAGKPARVWVNGNYSIKWVTDNLEENWARACNIAKWVPTRKPTTRISLPPHRTAVDFSEFSEFHGSSEV